MIVCVVVVFLFSCLPPHSIASRVIAALSGCVIVAIIVALDVVDLSSATVSTLAMFGIGLSLGLLDWRSRLNVAHEPQ